MLILRGIAGHFVGRDWPRGALDQPSALEYARLRGYVGEVLDVDGATGRKSRQVRMCLNAIRDRDDIAALYGFSGGGYNIRHVLAALSGDQRRRIKLVVVLGAPKNPPALYRNGSWELVYRLDPPPPAGHMASPKALLAELESTSAVAATRELAMAETSREDGMTRVAGRNIYIISLAKAVNRTGSVDAFVARCAEAQLSSIWIRLGYGIRLDRNLKLASFNDIQQKLRDKGIKVWGWHVPRCPNMECARQEAELVETWARQYALDGILLDAEHGSAYFQGGRAEAEQYVSDLGNKLTALGKGLALSSHDQPRLFPGFPFATFLEHVPDNCPQVYYTRDVAGRLGRSIRDYRTLESAREFQDRYKPVGNITVRGDVPLPNPASCLSKAGEFFGLVASNGFKAYSFWCWDEAPDEIWQFFREHPVFPKAPPEVVAELSAAGGADEISGFAADMQAFRVAAEDLRSEFFDSTISPQIEEFAVSVRSGGDVDDISRWLQVQAMALDLAVEGVSEITFDLWRYFRDDVDAAMLRLSADQRSRIEWLFREFSGEDTQAEFRSPELEHGAAVRAMAEAPATGTEVFASFAGERTFTSRRGFPVVQGLLKVMAPADGGSRSYLCNSGGGARTSHSRNGPIPPGTYRVSNYRPNRTTTGMVLDGVGFSLDLDPVDGTRVYGRSLFRIHPDGGSPGTNGCLGIREDREKLREAESSLANLLRSSGPFKLVVTHNL
jgi:hypothetical protein